MNPDLTTKYTKNTKEHRILNDGRKEAQEAQISRQ
jgi:hypothetical protein